MSTCSSVGFAVSSDSFHFPLAGLSCHPVCDHTYVASCIILGLRIISIPRIFHLSQRIWSADVADSLSEHLFKE